MTALRRRMDDDMLARGLADRTRESYLWAVTGLARFYRRSPDQITDEEIQAYVVHLLRDRRLSWSTRVGGGWRPCTEPAAGSEVRLQESAWLSCETEVLLTGDRTAMQDGAPAERTRHRRRWRGAGAGCRVCVR